MRKSAAVAALACAMMLAATSSFAQLKYFEDGQSGFTAATGLNGGEDFQGYDIGFVYTAGGRLDLGLAFGQVSLDDAVLGTNGAAMAVTPSLTFGLVRPTPEFSVGVEFSVAVESGFFTSDVLDLTGQDLTKRSLRGLLAVNTWEQYSPSLTVYPEMFVGYSDADTKLDGRSSDQVESDISDLVFGGSFSARFNDKVLVTASYTSIDFEGAWGLAVGYVASPSQVQER